MVRMPSSRGNRRRVGWALAAAVLGVALGVLVAGAGATGEQNVFSGNWVTNLGHVSFAVAGATQGQQELSAAGGTPCAAPTVYYVGSYQGPGAKTGTVAGCTAGSANHLVARYLGDRSTDPGATGAIVIDFVAPSAFNGTIAADSSDGQAMPYVGSFQAHFAGDGCCPAGPPSTTSTGTTTTGPTTTATTPAGPPAGPADVTNVSIDSLFPVTGIAFSGEVATFESTAATGTFTATIDWGDGGPPTPAGVGAPVARGKLFDRSVSGSHTYARAGIYPVRVTISDPRGAAQVATDVATVTACVCVNKPPVLGRTVDIGPVSGHVFIQLPPGARAARLKGNRFVPLVVPREIPIGSVIDARQGQLVLMTATATPGRLGAGLFSGGLFQLLQNRRELGVTELRLRSGPILGCRAIGKAHVAAARRLSQRVLGLLRASVKGQFRTRGRYSAGTVRGTRWSTTDRCDGTLTAVARGAVSVFDFRARRTVFITAGHSYLARAG
jgi:hypothetical protein